MEENSTLKNLVLETIEAYKMFLSDSLALDYCKVESAWRRKITSDKTYRLETRKIRAKSFRDQLDELEEMEKASHGAKKPDPADYDLSDSFEKSEFAAAKKEYQDSVNLRLKIQEIKRELLALGNDDNDGKDEDAMNFFFCPVSKEQIDAMIAEERLEIKEGSATDDDVFDDLVAKSMRNGDTNEEKPDSDDAQGEADAEPDALPEKNEDEGSVQKIILSDGTVVFG